MKESFFNEDRLPLLIEPEAGKTDPNDLFTLLKKNKKKLSEKLLDCGGLLFRGWKLKGSEDFNTAIDAFGLGKQVRYIGGDSPRSKVKKKVYTSTDAPPGVKILLHNEMSFIKHHPNHIYFFCDTPPKEAGETILADCRKVYQGISKSVMERFLERELLYISRYYYKSAFMDWINSIQAGHKTWIDVFETEDKRQVEQLCQEHDFEFEWLNWDWIKLLQHRPAVKEHPKTKEMTWFNQAHLYDYNPKFLGFWRYLGVKLFYLWPETLVHEVHFGDGARIPRDDLYHVMDVLDACTIKFPWQKGDFLALDNVLAMHGRAPFQGKRRILTALTS